MAGQAKDIKERVLWVIQSNENQRGGGGTDLRIVEWVIDGKPTKPALEKREWYNSDQDGRKLGKAKGMTSGDLYTIIKNIKAIAKMLGVKPEHLDEVLQLALYQDDKTKPTEAKSSSTSETKNSPAPEPATVGAVPDIQF